MDKVSIIIPTKDRLPQLKKAIPLYLKEPEVGEVIIVIDGSTDGTREYLEREVRKESRLKYFDNGINKGVPYSRNAGIAAAAYPYTFSTEDDLEITSGFFATLLAHMKEAKADVICGRNIFRMEQETSTQAIVRTDKYTGRPIDLKTIDVNTSMRVDSDSVQIMIASPMLAKTEVFRKVKFDERYKVNFWREETDFQLSAQEQGLKLVSCPHAVCFNYSVKNRSGVHAAVGLRRVKWVTINNWRFIRKHRTFIAQHFAIGSPYVYIVKFVARRVFIELVLPILVEAKRKLKTGQH
jgi:glycosyltransferase involved in cell wall biosynthesis